jgi:hypothetical protein
MLISLSAKGGGQRTANGWLRAPFESSSRAVVANSLSYQLGPEDFLRFLRILQNPVREFPMCLPEFIREFAIFIEKLYARNEYRRRGSGLLDQHLMYGMQA